MKTTIEFLNRLETLNIRLSLQGEQLRFRAPPGVFTEEIKAELAEKKSELVRLLRSLPLPTADKPVLTRAGREGPIPLSLAQQRLWFLDQLQPGVPAYNMYDALEILREVDVNALRRAVNEVVKRHEILRTTFPAIN